MTEDQNKALKYGRIAAMLPVKVMDRALMFYRDRLGFEVSFQNGNPVQFVILRNDAAELHLTLQPNHTPPDFNIAHMLVTNVDELHALCVAHGLTIAKPLRNHDFGMRMFVFKDPDGNLIDAGQAISQ